MYNSSPLGTVALGTIEDPGGEKVTGVAATGELGTVSVETFTNFEVSSVTSTASLGAITTIQHIDANISVLGFAPLANVGTVTPPQSIEVPVTGSSATGEQGTPNVALQTFTDVTGVQATGETGDAIPRASVIAVIVSDFPMEIISEQGDVLVEQGVRVFPTGSAATGATGSPQFGIAGSVSVSTVLATGELDDVDFAIGARVPANSTQAITFLGEVLTLGDIIPAPVTGVNVFGTGQVGNVTIDSEFNALIVPEGLQANGQLNNALVWGPIDTGTANQWTEIVT